MEKLCPSCRLVLSFEQFSTDTRRGDGKQCYCKACQRARRMKNKITISEQKKKYRAQNREADCAYQADYFKQNKERIALRRRKYRENNREKCSEARRKYRAKTKEHSRKKQRAYRNRKYKVDAVYRVECCLRSRLVAAMRGKTRSERAVSLVGCSWANVVEHLESLFQPGMSWDNYGHRGWHIDHIVPCKEFDLSKREDQKECFHYTNLRPLWAEDNFSMRKNRKRNNG